MILRLAKDVAEEFDRLRVEVVLRDFDGYPGQALQFTVNRYSRPLVMSMPHRGIYDGKMGPELRNALDNAEVDDSLGQRIH